MPTYGRAMQLNVTVFLFLGIVGVAALVIHGRGRSWSSVRDLLGLRLGPGGAYLGLIPYTIGAIVVLAVLARVVLPQTFSHPPLNTTLYGYSHETLGVGTLASAFVYETFMTALGEELLFRGLIAGWLLGWLGARWGNLAQALVFLLPHLPLIIIAPGLWWLVLVAALGGGLTLGLVRQRTGSILPGLLGHGIGNTVAAGVTMWMAHL
jgi:membrane protease YdiL (CAAX protease family)